MDISVTVAFHKSKLHFELIASDRTKHFISELHRIRESNELLFVFRKLSFQANIVRFNFDHLRIIFRQPLYGKNIPRGSVLSDP